MSGRIEDYALIGDTRTAALVSREGSVDWLCVPRFDSPSCFGALLGDERHGCWSLCPGGDVRRRSRRYRPGTLVLESEFETPSGAVRIGGVGVADEWTGKAEDPDSFRETHVRVRGPVVRGLVGAFAQDWLDATGEVLSGAGFLAPIPATPDRAAMQLVRSSPRVRDTNAEALYHFAIAAAQKSIDLTPSYLVPSAAFRQALCHAARRGVRVRVVVAGPHTNHVFMKYANRAAYDELLAGGVEIFEFEPTMLHAKTMVVDDVWSSISSINFDNRSFQLLNEATRCVQSTRVASRLTAQFERDLSRSQRIEPDQWGRRGPIERTLELVNVFGSEL
jgi:cardiolipin synthase